MLDYFSQFLLHSSFLAILGLIILKETIEARSFSNILIASRKSNRTTRKKICKQLNEILGSCLA